MRNKNTFVNPILAGDWLPIAQSLAHVFDQLPLASFAWATFRRFAIDEWGYAHPDDGPYLQVLHRDNGSLLAELGFGPELVEANPRVASTLVFLGFTPPTPGDPDHPNFSKMYPVGWNAREVTKDLTCGILLSGTLTTEEGFSFHSPNRQQLTELGLVHWSNGLQMWVATQSNRALAA
jgi:hypothetical protein